MADDADYASSLIDIEISSALNRARQASLEGAEGPKECEECGEDIPAGRRKLGFKLCVSCAEESERKRALFAD